MPFTEMALAPHPRNPLSIVEWADASDRQRQVQHIPAGRQGQFRDPLPVEVDAHLGVGAVDQRRIGIVNSLKKFRRW